MNKDYSVFRDPENYVPLSFRNEKLTSVKGTSYPIIAGIPRFVGSENYASDFGLQWNLFSKTQLDSHTGTNTSLERLSRCLNGHLDGINGKLVLEAGCGAGRFTEVLLKNGAIVHSFDLSNAVEANMKNNGKSKNLILAQADIDKIPFPKRHYDYVICLGVLQHTPITENSILNLYEMVRPGGCLIFDHYIFKWRNVLPPPIGRSDIIYRKILLALPQEKRFKTIKKIVDFFFPLHWQYKDSLTFQRILRRISPVHFYYPHMALRNKQMYYEWALLDTHDYLTDNYKHHRSIGQIEQLLRKLNANEIVVNEGGTGLEAFCRKPE